MISEIQNTENQYPSQDYSKTTGEQNFCEDDTELKSLVSKKKEQHRVEIRKKQNNQQFKNNRLQVSYLKDLKRHNDLVENDTIDPNELTIDKSVDSFIRAYHANNFEFIKSEVQFIRLCVTLEDRVKDEQLEYSNKIIFEKGALQFLITYLSEQYDAEYELQRDTIWIMAHFLSQSNLNHILYVLQYVPLQTFTRLLETGNSTIKEYTLLSIQNIIDQNHIAVQHLIENGIIQIVQNLVLNFLPNNLSKLQIIIEIVKKTLQCFSIDQEHAIPLEQLTPIIDVLLPLFKYVKNKQDEQSNLFKAILKIIQKRDDGDIDQFYSQYNGLILKTLDYMKVNSKSNVNLLKSPLRILQILANSYDHITEVVFILGNVFSSGVNVIYYIMDHKIIIRDIITVIEGSDFMLKKDATIALSNLLITIEESQIEEFEKDYNGISILIQQIKYYDIDLNKRIVQALYNIVNLGESIKQQNQYSYNIYSKKFNEYGGREKVIGLAESQNEELKAISEELLALTYIVDQNEDEMDYQYQEDNYNTDNQQYNNKNDQYDDDNTNNEEIYE